MQALPSSAPATNASYVIPTKIAALKMTETAIVAVVRRCQKPLMKSPQIFKNVTQALLLPVRF